MPGFPSTLRQREHGHGEPGHGRDRAGPPRAGLSSTGHSALLGQEKGLGVLPQLVPCPQHQRRHHEASHAELTFVECRVQEGVVEEQAPALSPALGLAPHHQLAVAGCLQTFRHKEREDRRVRRAEFPVVGQQGANSELYVSPTLLWRGCSPSESDLNPKPGAAQALPTPCLLPPAFSLSPASSALQTLLSYLEQLPSPQRPWPGGVHKGARLLGYFPTSGPKADPACSFLQPCSNDPAPSKVGGQELYWGWKMGSVVALPQAPHGPTPSLSPPPRCCLRVIHGATRTEIQGGHKMLTGKQLCEGHLKDKQK